MQIRNVDSRWDWTFGQSQTNYVKDEYAIILDIQMRIKEWYGDCFFALQNGIPWQTRLGSHGQKGLLDQDLIKRIQETDGVLRVSDFSSSTDGRRYRAQCSVYTRFSIEPAQIEIDTENFIYG